MSYPEGTLQAIPVAQTYPLRQRVLRPQQSINECMYACDHAADSYHVGYFLNQTLVGVGTIFREARNSQSSQASWRIRGMAVAEELRGAGIGGKLLQALIDYVEGQGIPAEIWCNGRVSAKTFYERSGFVQASETFDLPSTGPHMVFIKTLAGSVPV